MKWIIGLTIFAFLIVVYLLYEAIKDGKEPEPSDKTIKRVVLRNKLNKIEEERELNNVNIDYQNYQGR